MFFETLYPLVSALPALKANTKKGIELVQSTHSPETAQVAKPHGVIAKTIHWSFIVFFIYAISKGLDNVNQLSDIALLRFEMVFAAVFLGLLVARFVFMKYTQPTALPENTPRLKLLAARYGHLGIYISVGMIAVSGMMIGALYWIGLTSGFIIDTAVGLHELSIIASYGMIALHILAALYHRLRGDGIWSSMVPIWKEKGSTG